MVKNAAFEKQRRNKNMKRQAKSCCKKRNSERRILKSHMNCERENQGLSRIAMDYSGSSRFIKNYQGLPRTIKDYEGL